MDVQNVVFDAMESVLGIEPDDLKEDMSLDLIENGILDSLGIVSLLNEIGKAVGKKIEITDIAPEEFRTVDKFIAAVEAQLS